MTINLDFEEFNAPFELICVELPAEYAQSKAMNGAIPNLSLFYTHPKKDILAHDVIYGDYALKSWIGRRKDRTVEYWMEYDYSDDVRLSDIPTNEQEYVAEQQIRRAVANYCLLLDEVGTKQCGPASPNEYAQLVKWCQKKNQHTTRNKLNLQTQGIVYSTAKQPTNLVRVVKTADELPTSHGCGRTVSPHSRRGHYRMQRFGIGNAERKRIRIPPTIVNKHLLLGRPPGGTYTT